MSTQNIASIHYRDLTDAPKPAPGQFALEVFFKENSLLISQEKMKEWVTALIQGKGELPGARLLYPCPENNPPFLVLQIIDYSHPSTARNLNAIEDQRHREPFDEEGMDQSALKRKLSAPSNPSAVMAKFLGYAVEAKEMDQASASLVLMQQFRIPERAAKGIVQRSLELVRDELGTHLNP